MAVPAHDERDFEFARKFGLEIRRVVEPVDDDPAPEDQPFVEHTDNERLVNSGRFDEMPAPEAIRAITAWLGEQGLGGPAINYRLRDWLVSRQRYWGAPIPDDLLRPVRDRAGIRERAPGSPSRHRGLCAAGQAAAGLE